MKNTKSSLWSVLILGNSAIQALAYYYLAEGVDPILRFTSHILPEGDHVIE